MKAYEARHWHPKEGRGPSDQGRIVCTACPRECQLSPGQHGFCYVRRNDDGRLVLVAYGRPGAVAVDPVEKKPLFHFLPGTTILSLGTAGCNLGCRFCQNWDLTRARDDSGRALEMSAGEVVDLAVRTGASSIAFTYNDPTVFVEYACDIADAGRARGLPAVAVTAGYIGRAARDELYSRIDAANIDLKGFTDEFYRRLSLGRLAPVLETIEDAVRRGVWVELTTLLIPGQNDSDGELRSQSRWILEHAGRDVPLHFTAFHPSHRLLDVGATPPATLRRARDIALAEGLRFVYTGNVVDADGSTTRCPGCQLALVERSWHAVRRNTLTGTDRCARCGERIPGVFDHRARASSTGLRTRVSL